MPSKIGFKIIRVYSRLSKWWKGVKLRRFEVAKRPIDSDKLKAIELFYVLTKDKNSKLNYSKTSSTAIIDSDLAWMTMFPTDNQKYSIQIIDESESRHHPHDLIIPSEYAYEMLNEFHEEMEKRFRSIDKAKRSNISNDLDVLINRIKNVKHD